MTENGGHSHREPAGDPWSGPAIESLMGRLTGLRAGMLQIESAFETELAQIPDERRPSARNLLHYVALRQQDLRPLQESLVARGLSSLGRCEAQVLTNVEAVLEVLVRLSGRDVATLGIAAGAGSLPAGQNRIESATRQLLGPNPDHVGPRVMVTMPTAAATDYALVRDLVASGMDVMRINCAHDSPPVWQAMIAHLRRAEKERGRSCRVAMDLAGPKIRTGPIEPGARVVRWQPARDSYGRMLAPARIWLFPDNSPAPPPTPADAAVPVRGELLGRARPGDRIGFRDSAGRRRRFRVVAAGPGGLWAESRQTSYLAPDVPLRLEPADDDPAAEPSAAEPVAGIVGRIEPAANHLVLHRGDRLMLCDPQTLGRPAVRDARGQIVRQAQIGCTLPEIFADLHRGERILFDDGRIGGVLGEVRPQCVEVEITRARAAGEKLRADKGINLPDSDLKLPALTSKDVADLEFIVAHADMVSYSFVRRVDDVARLLAELARLGRPQFPVVLKIENRQAFENLPRLLLAAMRNPAGVMIARGDLAVECGYERLAEVQEEILWMCEAAHMPVIWATQVLETMAKRGIPSRAEVTDAAMSVRAECVMLNKGPYIVETVRALEDILERMAVHQVKKRPMLRKLRLAEQVLPLKVSTEAD